MKTQLFRLLLVGLFLSSIGHTYSDAVSLSNDAVEKLRSEGKLQEWMERADSARARGVWQPVSWSAVSKAGKGVTTTVDSLRAIVLLVDFPDKPHVKDSSQFNSLLFTQGIYPTGSMRDYYKETSCGRFNLTGVVYGWIRAPQNYSYYVNNQNGLGDWPYNAQKLVEDAVSLADPYVNFANFDLDGDHLVDALFVVHAGPGAEETGLSTDIWSHEWSTSFQISVDGVKVSNYAMCPERTASSDLAHIGVYSHEFGHILGLIDLYAIDTGNGLGNWSIMGTGSWNNAGITPAQLDPWSKARLGWIQIDTVTSNRTNVEIHQIETSHRAFRIWANGTVGSQYFLVENRQKIGFDSYLPGSGLLIYHVDDAAPNNNHGWCPGGPSSPHYRVALEQADGYFNLEACSGAGNRGEGGDPFPGYSVKRVFEDTTVPSSRNYTDVSTQVAVWNISDSDTLMHANFDVSWSRPNLVLQDLYFNDSTGGDGDGRAEPGETVKLYFVLTNTWAGLSNAYAIASADTAGISFSIDSVSLGSIGSPDTVDNLGHPIQFTVASGFPSKMVNFTLHICGNGGGYCTDRSRKMIVGPAEILLVDDDNQLVGDSNYVAIYQKALDSLGAVYEVWDRKAKSKPAVNLSAYPILIWFTGNHRDSVLSSQDVQDLTSYLNGGGKLFLTSQDAAQKLSTSGKSADSLFLANYLHARYAGYSTSHLVVGVPADPIGDTMYISLGGEGYAVDNQVSKDILLPYSGASQSLKYAGSFFSPTDSLAGTKYQGTFKVVLFGFGFEAIDSTGRYSHGHYLSKPTLVMGRVLNWLRGGSDVLDDGEEITSLPKAIVLCQNYPNPFNPSTSIRFTVHRSPFVVHSPIRTSLAIYNILGKKVRVLLDEEIMPGDYQVGWDGKDDSGNEVSSGVYFYQVKAGGYSEVKKMVFLK
ncbi:MAG: M6 family metalloprotease domain-containing protein [Candidatus Zixiibacteriota bacterium]